MTLFLPLGARACLVVVWGQDPSITIDVVEVTSHMGWLKVWDTALDHGPSGTIAVINPQARQLSRTENVDGRV